MVNNRHKPSPLVMRGYKMIPSHGWLMPGFMALGGSHTIPVRCILVAMPTPYPSLSSFLLNVAHIPSVRGLFSCLIRIVLINITV